MRLEDAAGVRLGEWSAQWSWEQCGDDSGYCRLVNPRRTDCRVDVVLDGRKVAGQPVFEDWLSAQWGRVVVEATGMPPGTPAVRIVNGWRWTDLGIVDGWVDHSQVDPLLGAPWPANYAWFEEFVAWGDGPLRRGQALTAPPQAVACSWPVTARGQALTALLRAAALRVVGRGPRPASHCEP